jgi:hypothetical protein
MFGMVAFHILFSLILYANISESQQTIMEFKRFKRKGLIFNNNSIGLGLELRIGKKIKVYRIERLTKEDKTFEFLIYDGPNTIDGSFKNEIVTFLELRDKDCSFFEGEPKVWEKIKAI